MSKSVWSILILGVVGFALASIVMLALLSGFGGTPAGSRAKLAESIRTQFGLAGVTTMVRDEGGMRHLLVSYDTTRDSKFDTIAQEREMEHVATFAGEHYDGSDRRQIVEVRVVRTEIKGSGCWQESYVSNGTYPFKSPPPPEPPAPEKK